VWEEKGALTRERLRGFSGAEGGLLLMKSIFFACAVFCAAAFPVQAAREIIWGVTGVGGAASSLYAINPTNGQILRGPVATGVVNLTGLEVKGGVLLAVQGQLSPTALSPKTLFRIDRKSGKPTAIGTMASKYAISDVALREDGTLFAFGVAVAVKKLLTVDTATAAVTEIGAANNITNVSLTFGADGTLYLIRTNGMYTIDPATGAALTGPVALSGATTSFDNFMDTNSAGVIYGGLRTGASTNLYILNPATAATTLIGTVPGAGLSGIAFDFADAPKVTLTGKSKFSTVKAKVTLKGKVDSVLDVVVKVNGKRAKVNNRKWSHTVRLKDGKNVFRIEGTDGLGQKSKTIKVVVKRT
jgi:hypothetical protein